MYIVAKKIKFTAGKHSYQLLRTLKEITENHLTVTRKNLSKINYFYLRTFFPFSIKGITATFITFTVLKYKLHFYSWKNGPLWSSSPILNRRPFLVNSFHFSVSWWVGKTHTIQKVNILWGGGGGGGGSLSVLRRNLYNFTI